MGVLWSKSGAVEFDNAGQVAPGALARFYVGNTTTPLAVFEEASESTPHDHPVEADANGRWPNIFIPYIASYDVRVTTAAGTQLYYPTRIPNPNPVEAAADVTSDEELFLTGDIKFRHGTGTLTGYVRCNGRTIGSAASGATERANADCADLFAYLWNGFANSILAVSGGRGGSAAADFAANKTIAVFDMRMGMPIGVDDMGNSAASRGGSITFANGSSTTGGSHLGANTHTISEAQLPSHTHGTGTLVTGNQSADHGHSATTSSDGAHTHSLNNAASVYVSDTATTTFQTGVGAAPVGVVAITENSGGTHQHTLTTGGVSANHNHAISGSTASTGSGTAHNIVSYGVSGTWYIRL